MSIIELRNCLTRYFRLMRYRLTPYFRLFWFFTRFGLIIVSIAFLLDMLLQSLDSKTLPHNEYAPYWILDHVPTDHSLRIILLLSLAVLAMLPIYLNSLRSNTSSEGPVDKEKSSQGFYRFLVARTNSIAASLVGIFFGAGIFSSVYFGFRESWHDAGEFAYAMFKFLSIFFILICVLEISSLPSTWDRKALRKWPSWKYYLLSLVAPGILFLSLNAKYGGQKTILLTIPVSDYQELSDATEQLSVADNTFLKDFLIIALSDKEIKERILRELKN